MHVQKVMQYQFSGEVWLYQGESAWHFITLPKEYADEIKEVYSAQAAGFMPIKVNVDIGKTSFSTSIFPDNKSGSYLLPLKKSVRLAENINAGATISAKLEVVDRS